MVSLELSEEHMKNMYASAEAPGSEILKFRQMSDTPDREYLMNLQGLFSGKTSGDLDSVPGYYAGTTSYRWVQNAQALNQHRLLRHLEEDQEDGPVDPVIQEAVADMERVIPTLTPSAARTEAYQSAKALSKRPALKGPARGFAYKVADEFGARRTPSYKKPKSYTKAGYTKDAQGNTIWVPAKPIY
tara:strand:- start:14190 stop:14750 length:561 start_codon:yes stop_codon:yes gene_type:complete